MSKVIEFLERLGSDARLMQAAEEEVALALADAKIDAAAGEAILARDVQELHALLKLAPMVCFQTVPEEEEEEDEGEEGEEQSRRADLSATARAVHSA